MTLSADGRRLYVSALTANVALVRIEDLEPVALIDVGDAPSWATTSPDGRHCFVHNTRDDTLSVISYTTRREVARIPVGDGPKHVEAGRVPAELFRASGHGEG